MRHGTHAVHVASGVPYVPRTAYRGTAGREWVTKNWAAAMGFFNAVGEISEEEGHHPDLHLTG